MTKPVDYRPNYRLLSDAFERFMEKMRMHGCARWAELEKDIEDAGFVVTRVHDSIIVTEKEEHEDDAEG